MLEMPFSEPPTTALVFRGAVLPTELYQSVLPVAVTTSSPSASEAWEALLLPEVQATEPELQDEAPS